MWPGLIRCRETQTSVPSTLFSGAACAAGTAVPAPEAGRMGAQEGRVLDLPASAHRWLLVTDASWALAFNPQLPSGVDLLGTLLVRRGTGSGRGRFAGARARQWQGGHRHYHPWVLLEHLASSPSPAQAGGCAALPGADPFPLRDPSPSQVCVWPHLGQQRWTALRPAGALPGAALGTPDAVSGL